MTAYDPNVIDRLVREAREDDARMTRGTWSATPMSSSDDHAVIIEAPPRSSACDHYIAEEVSEGDAEAIARTRNNLAAMADQLEAAREIADNGEGWRMQCATNEATVRRLTSERDALRAEVKHLRVALDRSES